MVTQQQEAKFVGADLSIDAGCANVDIDVEGEYPLQMNNHFIMASVEKDNRKFRCVTCGSEVNISETVWRSSEPHCRSEATEYVIGYFLDKNCDSPETFRDVVDSVITPYIGEKTSPVTMHHIKRDLKRAMIDYE